MWQQARNLYGRCLGIRMDIPRLRSGPQPAETDSPDFTTHMQQLQPSALSRPLQALVSPPRDAHTTLLWLAGHYL